MTQKELGQNFERIVLDYCSFPIPRTRYMLLKQLKEEGFWPKTPARRAVALLNNKLIPLKEKGLLVEYDTTNPHWNEMKKILKKYCTAHNIPKPRKLQKLYQTNFFYSGKEFWTPVLVEHNFVLTAMFSRFKKPENFGMEALNLFLAYKQDPGKVRLQAYRVLGEKDAEILERVLDESQNVLSTVSLPFSPDLDNALMFISKLVRE